MSNPIPVKLDAQSVSEIAGVLKAYRKVLFPQAMKKALDNLAWDLEEMIQKDFARAGYVPGEGRTPSVVVAPVIHKKGFGFTIHVQGEQVGFLEFGTGIWADYTHPLAKNAPFDVYMGSFSESDDGKGTWMKWLESGKDPMKYPYNREGRYGLLHAEQYIKEHYDEYITDAIRSISI